MGEMSSQKREETLKGVEDCLKLIRSPEWKHYANYLKNRAQKLQKRVNQAVKQGDLTEAQISLAILEDSINQANLFIKKAVETKKSLTGEDLS